MKKRIFIWLIGCIVVSVTLLAGCNGNGGYDFIPPPFGGKARFNPGLPGEGTGDIKLEIREDSGYASLEGAEVFLDGDSEYTLSGSEDVVYINGVNSGAHALRIVCTGFNTYKKIITVKADQEVRIEVHMTTEGSGGDLYEPNNDKDNAEYGFSNYTSWTHDDPGEMSSGSCYCKYIYPIISDDGDEDWFKIDLYSDDYFYVRLTDVPGGCNYNVELYDSSGSNISSGEENDEIWNHYIGTDDYYYIRVYSDYGSDPNTNYTLYMEVDYY